MVLVSDEEALAAVYPTLYTRLLFHRRYAGIQRHCVKDVSLQLWLSWKLLLKTHSAVRNARLRVSLRSRTSNVIFMPSTKLPWPMTCVKPRAFAAASPALVSAYCSSALRTVNVVHQSFLHRTSTEHFSWTKWTN